MTNDLPIQPELLLQYSNECIFLLNKKGIITAVSSDVQTKCHLNKKKILHTHLSSIAIKKEKQKIKKTLSTLLKNHKNEHSLIFQIQLTDGTIKYLQARCINLLSNPSIESIVAYVRDISSQKKIENDLHQKNKEYTNLLDHYQIIADNTIDVIFQVTLSGTYTFMNKASKRIAGYDPEEMIGKKWMNFVPKKELPRYLSKVNELLKGKKIDDFQTFVIHKEGHLIPVEFSGSMLKKNNKTYITGVMRDLSKRINSKQELEQIAKSLKKQAEAQSRQLQESEKKYRRLIEHANEAILVAQDEYIKLVNPKFIEISGYTTEELISKPFIHFIHPDDREMVLSRYQRRIKGEHPPSRYEFRIIDKQNTIHWLEISSVKFTWNKKPATLNFLIDVSERKTLQDKYQRLFDNSPEFLAEVDGKTGEIVTVNQQMADSIGVPKHEMQGKKWSDFLPSDVYSKRQSICQDVLTNNKTRIFEDQRGKRYFRNIFTPIQYPDGKRNLQIIALDITNVKKIQQRLTDSEKKYRLLAEHSADVIYTMDIETGKYTFVSPAIEKLLGYSVEEAYHLKPDDILTKESYRYQQNALHNALKTKKPSSGTLELQLIHKKGHIIPVEIHSSFLTDKQNNPIEILGIVRDISDRKKIEEKLREAKNKLEQRVKERTHTLQTTVYKLKESEQRYRSLIETAPVGIGIVDLKGKIIDFNPAMKNITGFSHKDMDFSKHYVDKKNWENLISLLKKQGSIRNHEIELVRKNGEHYFALIDIEKIQYSGESAYFTIERDITKIKKAERRLKEIRDYLQKIIDSIQEVIIAVDPAKSITMWNETAHQLTGLSSNEVIGKSLFSLSVFDSHQLFSNMIRTLHEGYELSSAEETIVHSTKGTDSILRFTASSIKDPSQTNELLGILFVGTDVTKEAQHRGKLVERASYLLLHSSSQSAIDKFNTLQLSGYHGIIFTRGGSIKKLFSPTDSILYHYEDLFSTENSSEDFLQTIYTTLESFLNDHQKTIVLLDRIDYLITHYSFEKVLSLLYQINSLIAHHQAILLLRVNPYLLNERQIHFLKEELVELPSEKVEKIELDEYMYRILQYIRQLNERNIVVSFQKIGKQFSISKVTTKKRLDTLQKQGLITIQIKGRIKSVHITKKAALLLQQQKKTL